MRKPAAIAVTGVGAVTPYGQGWAALLDGLSRGRSAIAPLSIFDNPLASLPVVGQVTVPLDMDVPPGHWFSRSDRLAILAALDVIADAALQPEDRERCAVVMGGTVAGLSDLEPAVVHTPTAYYRSGGLGPASSYPVGHVADSVANALGLGGPRFGISVACSSSALAIASAADMFIEGRTDAALAGGSDALCPASVAGFAALQALDGQPCRPFNRDRAGLNLGEGAAAVMLEDQDHARRRGATVLALLIGWASTNDAFHPTAPDETGAGLARSMSLALEMAGVSPDEVGYVNAHGTGTRLNDVAEARAYEQVFGRRATPVRVSSTKSYLGHTLGAAGAMEAVITLLSLRAGRLFPTLRLVDPIESPSVEFLRGDACPTSMEVAMSVSAGFGGSNTSLVFALDRKGGTR